MNDLEKYFAHADGSPLELEPWQQQLLDGLMNGKLRRFYISTGRDRGWKHLLEVKLRADGWVKHESGAYWYKP